jgi:probable rRNA maturation factor
MQVQVDIEVASISRQIPDAALIEQWIGAALAQVEDFDRDDAEVSLYIVDDSEGQELNQQYRGKNYPTNVLSFPADLPEELDLPLLGDLVICAPVVEREALEQNKTLTAHWAHMLVHGTLHLLGFDHIDDDEAEAMEALETRILTSWGFEAPYASEHL